MEIKDNRCFKKFKDLDVGDIFCITSSDVYMKIPEISITNRLALHNAISLRTGTLYAMLYTEDVKILKVSLVIE